MDDHVTKPIRVEALVAALAQATPRDSGAAAANDSETRGDH
jgi:CheY-like chemotaxis protein